MEITVGVKNIKEAQYYIKKGVKELYFGYSLVKNNRIRSENFSNIKEILDLLEFSKRRKIKTYLTVNDFIPEKNYQRTLKLLITLKNKGLKGIILKDPSFLDYLNYKKFKSYFILSTLSNVYNIETLNFFKKMNISRIVLPMQMLSQHADKLVKNKYNIDIEIFCQPFYWGVNVDNFCYLPCPQTGAKKTLNLPDYPCLFNYKKSDTTNFTMPIPEPSLLASSFYDYYKMGVKYVKIARWSNIYRQIDLFLKLKYLLKLLKQGISREKFIQIVLKIDSKPLKYGQTYSYKNFS